MRVIDIAKVRLVVAATLALALSNGRRPRLALCGPFTIRLDDERVGLGEGLLLLVLGHPGASM